MLYVNGRSIGFKEVKGNRKDLAKPNSCLKVSSVRALAISTGGLFHKMGSLVGKAAFLRYKPMASLSEQPYTYFDNSENCFHRSKFSATIKFFDTTKELGMIINKT